MTLSNTKSKEDEIFFFLSRDGSGFLVLLLERALNVPRTFRSNYVKVRMSYHITSGRDSYLYLTLYVYYIKFKQIIDVIFPFFFVHFN